MKANKTDVERLLNTAKGQIDGMLKMVNNNAYCIDISNQILACIAILKKVNSEILSSHLHCCVLNATTEEEKEKKLDEINEIVKKLLK